MHAPLKFFAGLLLGVGLFVPLFASAALTPWVSFGGKVLDINFCANGAVQFLIKPAGAFPISYMWTPLTRNNIFSPTPAAPPFFGTNVLGVAGPVLYYCLGPGRHPLQFVGLPVFYMKSSSIPSV